ncbi:UvrABC system protein C [Nymphon striatum]|nr:UvrABC system protein C [Nymphon striatum]
MSEKKEQTDPKKFDSAIFLKSVPHKPGVYRMISADNKILYVGKAKDLKNRVSSYFRGTLVNSRIYSMVKQIQDVQITLTGSEAEALLLESNLIKKHHPRYNILLRDDKSYPYIHLSQHQYPKLSFHRGSLKKKGQFFGPYPSAGAVRETLNLLQKLFLVRQCEDSYFANRSRPCLQYQIERCTAPCTEEISEREYQEGVDHTVKFLQGKSEQVIDELVKQMDQTAARLEYEKAARYRDKIEQLRVVSQQQYVSGGQGNVDVIAIQYASNVASVQVLTIRKGNNLGNKNFFPKIPSTFIDDSESTCDEKDNRESEILSSFIAQYYMSHEIPAEILLSQAPENEKTLLEMLTLKAGNKVSIAYKLRSDRARWVDMAMRNAQHALNIHLASKAGIQKRILALQAELDLDYIPSRMECFDISHTMGEATVASCVVFGLEGAIKSEYRRYNIKDIIGGDDYAAMKQVLERRFKKRVKDDNDKEDSNKKSEDGKLPDILFIDGGKGQVSQAIQVLSDLQISGVDIIGVTKGEGRRQDMDTLIVIDQENRKQKVDLRAHSSALHLIQQIRDEAHRFAITGHRQRRQKARTTSPLEGIEGLGPKRRQNLLKQFGGIRAITRASVDELSKVKGISAQMAENIYDMFHKA